MKSDLKLAMSIMLSLMIAIMSIGLVKAQPLPIGTMPQPNPFESNPTDHVITGFTGSYYGTPTQMYDGDLSIGGWVKTFTAFTSNPTDASIEFANFTIPASPTFDPGWVEIKIKYEYASAATSYPDSYRIEYAVGTSAYAALQPDVSGPDSVFPANIRPWSQLANATGDGSWTWADIADLKVRFFFTKVGTYWDGKVMAIHEVWVTVHPLPLPLPGPSPAISVQPLVVANLATDAPPIFFVEVYANNFTKLWGYQFDLEFNTSVLTPYEAWHYYPWKTPAVPDELNDTAGVVKMQYYTYGGDLDPFNGSSPIARIYFMCDLPGNVGYSLLHFSVSKMSDPTGAPITHANYHGLYGTPPADTHLMSWTATSELNWSDPRCTYWVETYPEPGVIWHLTSWTDNTDERFTATDQIDMLPEPPDGYKYWYHVDAVGVVTPSANVYMIVTFKTSEPTPEFPLGLGLMMLLALAIPIVYLWRTRKKEK